MQTTTLRFGHASVKRPARRVCKLESLEMRNLMASISFDSANSKVTIYGDNTGHDDAVITGSNAQVTVKVTTTPINGFNIRPAVVTRAFAPSQVKEVVFYGNAGNDSFINNWYNSGLKTTAYGGAGNDYLEGYNGVDNFFGGSGDDVLKGYGGDDNLYGESGRDKLYGGSGRDGLYGGADADELWGGPDPDRFLVMEGQTEHKDSNSTDAVIWFRNGSKTFNETEIRNIDAGLRVLHLKTGNDNLLEMKNGTSMTFVRETAKGTTFADNNSAGRIRMYDSVFASTGKVAQTVIHEIGHNWDTEHSNYSKWESLSGWRNTAPPASLAHLYTKGLSTTENWWYLTSAKNSFGRTDGYGKTNPREDWSTAWESYFNSSIASLPGKLGTNTLTAAKRAHLDTFFASLA